MKDCGADNDEGEQEVEGKEPGEGGIVHGEATSDPLNEGFAHVGDGRKKVGNNSGSSERYLASGEDVAYEGSHYNKEEKNNSNVSSFFQKV